MTNRSTFNQTLPIFFKSKEYKFLIVGSDKISLQLVTELIDNYADCKLKVVALNFDEEWKKLEQSNKQLELKHTHFNDYFLNEIDFVITPTV
jgi:siroheme synthase (precorrin-2 oxidase/ferrochelatase)